MSGGSHNYISYKLSDALGILWGHYEFGKGDVRAYRVARRVNPMEDEELSEMMYDVCCLLHSLEWYKSGDNCEEKYTKDKEYFKAKWLRQQTKDRPVTDKERMIEETCDRLEQMLERLKHDDSN